jgi:protein SCO1/2
LLLTGAPAAAGEPVDMLAAAAIEPEKLGAAVPKHLMLQDTAGRQVAVGDLLGRRPILLVPVDYGCKNICGVTLAGLLGALEELEWLDAV